MRYSHVIEEVPDYQQFLTVDELDARTIDLARRYPNEVELIEAGRSTAGHPIYCLKIGNGSRNALAIGCPHPNEPIGSMTLEYLSERLAGDRAFREDLDYTWYIIKCSDPDGTALNEKWFKGPYTIYNYIRNFYRPASNRQVEWTFPIDYKRLSFHAPIAETRALIRLIDRIKPRFLYSLHNAGFGGAFWYISKEIPAIYEKLPEIAKRSRVPLNCGEAEVPFAQKLAPAVFKLINTKDMYEYYAKFAGASPEKFINFGTSSDDYANTVGNTCSLVCELPYFYDSRIHDESLSGIQRRDAILKNCDNTQKTIGFLSEQLDDVRSFLSNDNPFYAALGGFVDIMLKETATKAEWARNEHKLEGPAKVSELFDNLYVSQFYNLLFWGLFVRTNEYELAQPEKDAVSAEKLQHAFRVSEEELQRQVSRLEAELSYSTIPIRTLVRIQLESGLLAAETLQRRPDAYEKV